jgi:hypothetical protein
VARKKKKFNLPKEVRAIARERVGIVPPTAVIQPKSARAKVKHKKRQIEELD